MRPLIGSKTFKIRDFPRIEMGIGTSTDLGSIISGIIPLCYPTAQVELLHLFQVVLYPKRIEDINLILSG